MCLKRRATASGACWWPSFAAFPIHPGATITPPLPPASRPCKSAQFAQLHMSSASRSTSSSRWQHSGSRSRPVEAPETSLLHDHCQTVILCGSWPMSRFKRPPQTKPQPSFFQLRSCTPQPGRPRAEAPPTLDRRRRADRIIHSHHLFNGTVGRV